jgi:hypothetical protein
MFAKELLQKLTIGNSVAEFDIHLKEYFLETQIYLDFVKGRYDLVSGDKGTGKTAIYRIIKEKYRSIPELRNVELISGFNDSGNPVFQRLSQATVLSEGQYITVWKNYIVSLVGNYILDIYEDSLTNKMKELDRVLVALGLKSRDSSAVTVFSMITNLLKRLSHPSAAEVQVSVTESGMPIIVPRVEFTDIVEQEVSNQKIINSEDALQLVNTCVEETGLEIWVILDRLDEAFAGYPSLEIPALRALLRTYLDLQAFENIKLKLFVRNDLFRKITSGGFVNLTHVNAKRVTLDWQSEDLFSLLCQRIKNSNEFLSLLNLSVTTPNDVFFNILFTRQVDIGAKRPTTWKWILSRIRDGNSLLPPRNLIDLINLTHKTQIRREERSPRTYSPDIPLLEPDSIRRALESLSEQRVQDTLIAENEHMARFIDLFRNGKSEYDLSSLKKLFAQNEETFDKSLQELRAIGFLEQVGENYKIPMLYRDGLNLTQGKA